MEKRQVWDCSYNGSTRTVDVHVCRLRKQLPFLVDACVTVKQFGYKLLEPPPVAAEPVPVLYSAAADNVSYGRAVEVMDTAKLSGAKAIAMLTEKVAD